MNGAAGKLAHQAAHRGVGHGAHHGSIGDAVVDTSAALGFVGDGAHHVGIAARLAVHVKLHTMEEHIMDSGAVRSAEHA